MAPQQSDTLKHVNLIPLAGASSQVWQYKQKKEELWSHHRLVFELVIHSLWDIRVHFNLFSNHYTSDYTQCSACTECLVLNKIFSKMWTSYGSVSRWSYTRLCFHTTMHSYIFTGVLWRQENVKLCYSSILMVSFLTCYVFTQLTTVHYCKLHHYSVNTQYIKYIVMLK